MSAWRKPRWLGTGLVIAVVLLAPLFGGLIALHRTPSLNRWSMLSTKTPDSGIPADALRITWLGATTVYASDGTTSLLIDGFFSRPGLARVAFGHLGPDHRRINRALKQAGIHHLDAVLVLNAHFDHALDAPVIAERFHALLLGSESVANVARGYGVPEALIHTIRGQHSLRIGDFRVDFMPAPPDPQPPALARLTGAHDTVDQPLIPPARFTAWNEGRNWDLVLHHPQGTVLVQGGLGFHPHALDDINADLALVSVDGLSRQSHRYRRIWFHNVIEATRPSLVIPIRWDDRFHRLTADVRPLPLLLANIDDSLDDLAQSTHQARIPMSLIRPFTTLVLYQHRFQAAIE